MTFDGLKAEVNDQQSVFLPHRALESVLKDGVIQILDY